MQNFSTAIIIFSRHNSTRLPGKALKLIHGREMLGWVIDRARLVNNNIPVIVATSSEPQDDQIAEFSQSNGVFCFRGDLNNVLKRAIDNQWYLPMTFFSPHHAIWLQTNRTKQS